MAIVQTTTDEGLARTTAVEERGWTQVEHICGLTTWKVEIRAFVFTQSIVFSGLVFLSPRTDHSRRHSQLHRFRRRRTRVTERWEHRGTTLAEASPDQQRPADPRQLQTHELTGRHSRRILSSMAFWSVEGRTEANQDQLSLSWDSLGTGSQWDCRRPSAQKRALLCKTVAGFLRGV
ncbi:uncharacterized protein AAES06_002587 [Glossophaga mutica]